MGCGCGRKANIERSSKIVTDKSASANKPSVLKSLSSKDLDKRLIICSRCKYCTRNKTPQSKNIPAITEKCRKLNKKLFSFIYNPNSKCPFKKF